MDQNGLLKCPHCGKHFSKNGIKTHIWRTHTEEGKKYNPFKGKNNWNKGLNKKSDNRIAEIAQKCSNTLKGRSGRPITEETKEKLRQKRYEYLSKKLGNTAWEKVQRGEMTYLEDKFYKEVILKFNLLNQYDISYNYPFYPYFLDFAFLNINFIVELDGACHFKYSQRIEHDIKRDKYLIGKGWKIFRIAYNDDFNSKIQEFFTILEDINKYESNVKVLENRLYHGKTNEIKIKIKKTPSLKEKSINKSEKEKVKIVKNINLEKEKINIENVLNSNIDFSKFGWVKQVAELINKKPQKIKKWMLRYLPEFYEKECFKRLDNKT